jgi:hypothetical protein
MRESESVYTYGIVKISEKIMDAAFLLLCK